MSEADDALEGWVPVVRFPDQSPSFARGFEAGEVWRKLKDDPGYHECTTMAENRELYKDIATHLRYTCEIEPSEVEGWDYTKFIPVAPLHLRIVQ